MSRIRGSIWISFSPQILSESGVSPNFSTRNIFITIS